MSHHLQLGVSMSAVKETYAMRAEESDWKRIVTPYTYCFNVLIDWLFRDTRVGCAANMEGVAFILECGHENNAEAEQCFHNVRELHKLDHVLRSISFVPKNHCRAIQIADLIAFYSRRHGVATERAPLEERGNISPGEMMNLLAGSIPIRSFVATDFGSNAEGRPF